VMSRSALSSLYVSYYRGIAGGSYATNRARSQEFHVFVTLAFYMTIFMWLYELMIIFVVESPFLVWFGLICAIIHTALPFCLRFTPKMGLVSNAMFVSGLTLSLAFSYFDQGVLSDNMIWLAAPPLLSGYIMGRRAAITWMLTSFTIFALFIFLNHQAYPFPALLNSFEHIILRAFLVIGIITSATFLSLHFISAREHSEKKLQVRTKRVDDLFRVLFHDLASSMSRLGIGLTLIKRTGVDGPIARGLEIATEANDSMWEITQNVRKIYAASKGKTALEMGFHPLTAAVDHVTQNLRNDLQKKNISIVYDRERYQGLNVFVEPVSFKNQVFANIFSNCIKFSPDSGKIFVTAQKRGKTVTIEIRDEGVGIPPEILQNIFDLTKKTSRPGTLGELGSGFGMHIMKSFVDLYKGSVEVFSSENAPSGTTFRIHLNG
jgi:signal transduction histidine kinase